MEKFCPQHERPLKEFTAGPNAKRPGSKYWKCTQKLADGWCNYVEFEDSFITTKKFTQLPNGQVLETEEAWNSENAPVEAPVRTQTAPQTQDSPKSDIRAILEEINAKLQYLVDRTQK